MQPESAGDQVNTNVSVERSSRNLPLGMANFKGSKALAAFVDPSQAKQATTEDKSVRFLNGYGALPTEAYGRLKTILEADKVSDTDIQELKTIWGGQYGAFDQRPIDSVKPLIDNQYKAVINSIENTLATRTNSGLWQARIAAQKAIWDVWIDHVNENMVRQQTSLHTKKSIKKFVIESIPNMYYDIGEDSKPRYSPQVVFHIAPNIWDFQMYFRSNLGLTDNDKLSLAVELVIYKRSGETTNETLKIPDTSLKLDDYTKLYSKLADIHPSFRGKLFVANNDNSKNQAPRVFLKLRVFTKNTSELRWRLIPKFGPFDLLYRPAGSFDKEWINPQSMTFDPTDEKSLRAAYSRRVSGLMLEKAGEYLSTLPENHPIDNDLYFKYGNFVLIGPTKLATQLTGTVQSASYRNFEKNADYMLYLRCQATLAKWFYGKKMALTKVNQDRMNNYLNQDKRDLTKVLQFFGNTGDFLGKRSK